MQHFNTSDVDIYASRCQKELRNNWSQALLISDYKSRMWQSNRQRREESKVPCAAVTWGLLLQDHHHTLFKKNWQRSLRCYQMIWLILSCMVATTVDRYLAAILYHVLCPNHQVAEPREPRPKPPNLINVIVFVSSHISGMNHYTVGIFQWCETTVTSHQAAALHFECQIFFTWRASPFLPFLREGVLVLCHVLYCCACLFGDWWAPELDCFYI